MSTLDPGLSRQREDGLLRGTLRLITATFPSVDRGKGDAQALGKLLLSQVEGRAGGAEYRWKVVLFCHVCYVCYILLACQAEFGDGVHHRLPE
ncbi:hypothetical protein [Metapseudomonas otitidis]|uniref:hypothetical protein n=1 Tax=Metapseudomonas otitidis TaxID=319939 RepID=UPI001F3189E8|nr:hypothetical protein [Pseudomonas otitidis]